MSHGGSEKGICTFDILARLVAEIGVEMVFGVTEICELEEEKNYRRYMGVRI